MPSPPDDPLDPLPSPPDDPLDPLLHKKQSLQALGVHASTLDAMIKRGDFPMPTIINPGQRREIPVWPQSEYLRWKANLPVRQARVISEAAYAKRRKPKLLRRPS